MLGDGHAEEVEVADDSEDEDVMTVAEELVLEPSVVEDRRAVPRFTAEWIVVGSGPADIMTSGTLKESRLPVLTLPARSPLLAHPRFP
ncbi:unnamed protein product [Parascedosporium putredinis]|uniref:Uncharacterized protein n=1 Tax=Parascedosporium putredinis TaxID=1442378 RepID=A0A9P1GWZ9_9PEZI|nr:unnamed protein product [Parascedosporium putredinis]CAI7989261.1 unnamed protein product [Parascedosporium putredinis]